MALSEEARRIVCAALETEITKLQEALVEIRGGGIATAC